MKPKKYPIIVVSHLAELTKYKPFSFDFYLDSVHNTMYIKGKPIEKKGSRKTTFEARLAIFATWKQSRLLDHGKSYETVPRHREIGESLAKKIIKTAETNPPRE